MFSITDNERLRDAYALLMFMQSDVPASAEKKAAVKNMAVTGLHITRLAEMFKEEVQ